MKLIRAFQNHTFDASNSAETVTIDLTAGGASLEEIQSLLADWVAGNNAGIGLIGEFGNQAFFQSNGIAAGNSVGSSIDGDTSLSGLSIDDGSVAGGIGGSGLGQGTISLNLEFTAVTSIPEPSSALLLIGATGAVVARRRRR
ncbi:MAG: PEP-CTERM sorting domain-containing protein [Planctomycetota bacterium]